ncbi:unnamed protein product [Aureobasidium mustum]|uniref:Uncharacterized protein n=1 Tax=Aureobasidium mustum TaxID=2773714 RepID=A0A9N8PKC4_9PEZI|nr:unnamed protein product [Aureobasidium mustum]
MRSSLRLLVAALALMTIACFYFQISDLPNFTNPLRHIPQVDHASTSITSGDDSSSRSAPGFHIPHTNNAAEDSNSITTDPSPVEDEGPKPPNDKAVVMGALSIDDVAWATTKLRGWDAFVYTVDNDTAMPFHTDRNKGKEANAYLTYIIQNYDSLHETVAFVHSHEFGWLKAWHTDAKQHSNVKSLNSLNVDFVQRNGYANLRCLPNPGCPDEIHRLQEPMDESKTSEAVFAAAWREIFDNDDVPEVVGVACCAQFAASKQQILQRTKEEYLRMHEWLMNTELDDQKSGWVFEYLWHIIFGQESVYCPSLAQCYRDVYGAG